MRKRTLTFGLGGLTLGSLLLLAAPWSVTATALPGAGTNARRYEITVTNVTKGQVFAPVVAVTHGDQFRLFELGEAVSPGLAHLAEEGDPSMVILASESDGGTLLARTNGVMTMPGASSSVLIAVDDDNPYISIASMLVSTNDGFIALRDVPAPPVETTYLARVYDAGSEFNSEDCSFVPGPPCGSGGSHDPTPAEGYVRIHEGVHGIGGLAPQDFDWRAKRPR